VATREGAVLPDKGDGAAGDGEVRNGEVLLLFLFSKVPGRLKLLNDEAWGGCNEDGDDVEKAEGVVEGAKGLLDPKPVGWALSGLGIGNCCCCNCCCCKRSCCCC